MMANDVKSKLQAMIVAYCRERGMDIEEQLQNLRKRRGPDGGWRTAERRAAALLYRRTAHAPVPD
jgi:hypothetical protein